jgi:uncharacterized protein (DUF1778 family)
VNAKNDPKKGKPKSKAMKPTTFRMEADLRELLDDAVSATGASASYFLNAMARRSLRDVVVEALERTEILRRKLKPNGGAAR